MEKAVISRPLLFGAAVAATVGVYTSAGYGWNGERGWLQRDLGELRQDAEWHAASLACLSVVFSFDMVEDQTPSLFERSRSEVDVCYEKARWDHVFGKKEGTLFHRSVAFDGTNSVLQEHDRKRQSLHGGKLPELTVNGLGFFDLNMLVPASSSPTDENDVSLAGMLALSSVELRAGTELVGDRECFVVDRKSLILGNINATIWIDAERAGVPMRQHYFVHGSTVPIVEFEATKVVEVQPGLWVVVEGSKLARASWEGNAREFQSKLKVETDAKGALKLNVNPDLEPSVFSPPVPADYVFSNFLTGKVTYPKK